MIVSKEVEVKWHNFTKKYYKDCGYQFTNVGDSFYVDVNHLKKASTERVDVKCDYCGEIFNTEYRKLNINREYIDKDACKKCKTIKGSEVTFAKYGVDNINKLKVNADKLSEIHRTPFKVVKNLFDEKGLTLLSDNEVYENNRSRLFFICRNHKDVGIQETNFANIKKNKSCCFYGGCELTGINQRLDGELVYKYFESRNTTPLFKPKDYTSNNQPLPFICNMHKDKGIQHKCYYSFLSSKHSCYYCGRESVKILTREDEDVVFRLFKDKGLIVCKNQKYVNENTLMNYICKKHKEVIQQTSYKRLKTTFCTCELCRTEKSMNILNRYIRSNLFMWRKEILGLWGNRCAITKSKEIHVHDIDSLASIIDNSIEKIGTDINCNSNVFEIIKIKNLAVSKHTLNTGICIDKNLHVLFHSLYGKGINNRSDFNEFIQRLYNGEFDGFLKEKNLEMKSDIREVSYTL